MKMQILKGREVENQGSWESAFSDPQNHDPHRFCYLVHGLQSQAGRSIQHMAMHSLNSSGMDGGGFDKKQNIDLLRAPGLISEKKVISCSVIDQGHQDTFGEAGYILATPHDNVMNMSHEDLGTNFMQPDNVRAKDSISGQRTTVERLLNDTKKRPGATTWNEVRVKGSTDKGEVEIKGVWIKQYPDGEPVDLETAIEIKKRAYSMGLPIITLENPYKEYKDSSEVQIISMMETVDGKITEKPYAFAINYAGQRYIFDFDGNFKVYNKKMKSLDMLEEDFEGSMKVLETLLSVDQKNNLKIKLKLFLRNSINSFPLLEKEGRAGKLGKSFS